MPETKETNRKYVLFSHTFADMWAGDSADDAPEVTLSYRFAKPTKTQIQRLPGRLRVILSWTAYTRMTSRRSPKLWKSIPVCRPPLPRPF